MSSVGTFRTVHATLPTLVTRNDGQPTVDVGTTEAEIDLESPVCGVVAALLAAEGETVDVGADLIVLADDAVDGERYLADAG
ncbi:MAG: hypothetical protein L6367_15825 [Cellulomonas sp.]|nr:hypothetical protein [Cellulomonas sp.]